MIEHLRRNVQICNILNHVKLYTYFAYITIISVKKIVIKDLEDQGYLEDALLKVLMKIRMVNNYF